MSRQDDLKKLIVSLQRRRQRLNGQQPLSGAQPPAYISMEIEAVAKEIERLQTELVELSATPLRETRWPDPLPVTAGQVFICYARQDFRFVQTLAADLERVGLAAWWDIAPLTGDDTWSHTIEAALKDSQACLLVLSPDSVESDWVRREYTQALNLGLNLIPVLYRKCEPLPVLVERQMVNFVNQPYPEALRALLPLLGVESSHLPATPPVRPRRRRWPLGRIALLVFGGIVCAGWGYVALFGASGPEVTSPPTQPAGEVAVVVPAEASKTPTPTPLPPTETSTNTPVPPSDTPEPPPPTATVTPPPTATRTTSPTSSPSPAPVTSTASATARPAATRTPTPTVSLRARLAAPVLLAPAEGAVIQTGILTTFKWQWAGTLPADRYFEIRIWRAGQYKRGAFDAREVTTTRVSADNIYEFTGDVISARGVTGSEEYFWDVAIVRQDPYRVVSPQATPRRINIIVASDSSPQ